MLLVSRAPQDSINRTVSKSFISSSVYLRTTKISCSKKDMSLPAPITTSPPPIKLENLDHTKSNSLLSVKLPITRSKKTERREAAPFILCLKCALFHICTEQNNKEIILTVILS